MAIAFQFKEFGVEQDLCAMKVGTDGVLLGAWAEGGSRILDIGCGTGIVSLMMAQRFPEARVTAIDIEEDCCRQARANADNSPWGDRIMVEHASLQSYAGAHAGGADDDVRQWQFDSIVSNPPFFVDSLKNPDRARSLARHTDSLPFSALAKGVARMLAPGGVFSVVMAEECCAAFIDEAWFAGLYLAETVRIVTKRGKPVKRRLMRFSNVRPSELKELTVELQDKEGKRSEWFVGLTSDFYL